MRKFSILERDLTVRGLGLGAEYFPRYVNRQLRLHQLDVVLLTCILRGRGNHVIGKQTFPENGASLGITHYGQAHDVLTDGRGMSIINVYLDLNTHRLPSLPRPLQDVLPLWLPLHPRFRNTLNRIVRLQFDDPAPFAEPLFAIIRELKGKEAGFEEAILLQFKTFLIRCCRHVIARGVVPSTRSDLPTGAWPRIEKVRWHMDQHFAQAISLQDLADIAGISRTSLCRLFRQHTGKTVFDYLIERRIQAAMVLLRGGDEKILTIALECGFQDLAYFNRKFRQMIGMTPGGWRSGATTQPIAGETDSPQSGE